MVTVGWRCAALLENLFPCAVPFSLPSVFRDQISFLKPVRFSVSGRKRNYSCFSASRSHQPPLSPSPGTPSPSRPFAHTSHSALPFSLEVWNGVLTTSPRSPIDPPSAFLPSNIPWSMSAHGCSSPRCLACIVLYVGGAALCVGSSLSSSFLPPQSRPWSTFVFPKFWSPIGSSRPPVIRDIFCHCRLRSRCSKPEGTSSARFCRAAPESVAKSSVSLAQS